MLGIIVLIATSWLLFKFILRKELVRFWFLPLSRSFYYAFTGFCILLVSFGIPFLIKNFAFSVQWDFNDSITPPVLLDAFWFYTKSVLTEELVFRGVLLSLLLHFSTSRIALIASSLLFGVYHWFSYGMFGAGIIPMLYVLILTGSFGFVWAYMYLKTESIVLPVTFHLGWNFTSSLIYEYQPFGELLFSSERANEMSELNSFLIQFGTDLLAIGLALVTFRIIWRNKKADPKESA